MCNREGVCVLVHGKGQIKVMVDCVYVCELVCVCCHDSNK